MLSPDSSGGAGLFFKRSQSQIHEKKLVEELK
jgi:hypothetical protein